jgi:hypothetical protein
LAGLIEVVAWIPQSDIVGAYAWHHTQRVARTAIEPFGAELVIDADAIFIDRN